MVKIPRLDELKKMGTNLIDQAKAVKFSEMVDKVKSGIESVSGKKAPVEINDETLKNLFQGIYSALNDVTQAQAAQVNAVKKIETQLEQLAKIVEILEKAQSTTETKTTGSNTSTSQTETKTSTTSSEDNKPNE